MKDMQHDVIKANLALCLDSSNKSLKSVTNSDADLFDSSHKSKCQSSFVQVLAAFVALLGAWSIGCVLCYSSPAIPSMKRASTSSWLSSSNSSSSSLHHGPFLALDDYSNESWITSIINLGALAGSTVGGSFNNHVGHKRFLFITGIGCTVGWIMIAFASNVLMVLSGRALTGFCVGFTCVSVPVYIVEISTIGSRGFLGCSFQGMLTLGVLFTSTCGAWLEWRSLALLCSFPAALMAILIIMMPESPYWLLRHKRINDARQSLASLRSRHSDISGEMQMITEHLQSVSNDTNDDFNDLTLDPTTDLSSSCSSSACSASLPSPPSPPPTNSSTSSSASPSPLPNSFIRDLKSPIVWKPLILGILLMSFQQLSGSNGLIGCLETVLRQTGNALDARMAAILVNSALVLSAWLAAMLVNTLGRKTLLIMSSGGYLIAYTMLSAYYALDARPSLLSQWLQLIHMQASTFAWTPVIALFIFFLLHAIGYGGVPWFLVPELCVNSHRAQIASICSTINWTLSFLVMKNFTPMLASLGSTCTFAIFACLSALSGIFVIWFVPETKGKSMSQIRAIFQK